LRDLATYCAIRRLGDGARSIISRSRAQAISKSRSQSQSIAKQSLNLAIAK
jgi:hypothetical protein